MGAFVALCLVLIAGLRPVGLDRDAIITAVIGSNMGGAFLVTGNPFWLINAISQRSPFPAITTSFVRFAGCFGKNSGDSYRRDHCLVCTSITLYFVSHETYADTDWDCRWVTCLHFSRCQKVTAVTLFRLFVATCFHYSALIGLLMLVSKGFSVLI